MSSVPVPSIDASFFQTEEVNDLEFAAQFANLETSFESAACESLTAEDMERLMALRASHGECVPGGEGDESDDEAVPSNTKSYLESILSAHGDGMELASDDEECGVFAEAPTDNCVVSPVSTTDATDALAEVCDVTSEVTERALSPLEIQTSRATQDIALSMREGETMTEAAIGRIVAHLDGLVVVEGITNLRPLDLRSVLCVESGEVIGIVADVFGRIAEARYLVYPTNPDYLKNPAEMEEAFKVGSEVFAIEQLSTFAIDCDPRHYVPGKEYEALDDCSADSDSEQLALQ